MNFFPLYSYNHFLTFFETPRDPAIHKNNRVDICRKIQNIGYTYGLIFVGHLSNCRSFLDYGKWAHYRVFAVS